MAVATRQPPLAFVVEDDALVARLMREILEEEGWNVTTVGTVVAAERALTLMKRSPRLVVLDHKLPDGRGLSLVLRIRRRFPDARVLLVTGSRSLTRELEGVLVDAVFHKPFELKRFLSEVRQASQARV